MNNICTWLCIDEKGEESLFPQTGIKSSSQAHQNIYWRCIVVFFISSKRYHKNEKHILFTNSKSIPIIDGIEISEILKLLEVEIIYIPFTYKPPKNYWKTFQNQFYEFSILDYISNNSLNKSDYYLILDSDCFFIKPVYDLFLDAKQNNGFAAIHEDTDPNYLINGLSLLDMKQLFEDLLGLPIEITPQYYLGEFFLCNTENIKIISNDFQELWPILLKRHEDKKLKFNEEAHVLSFLYYKNGLTANNAKKYIKRIWTNPVFYRNVNANDVNLNIWHLPSEKRFGFEYLFNFLIKKRSDFAFGLDNDKYIKKVFIFFSVPNLTIIRYISFYFLSYWRAGYKRFQKFIFQLCIKNYCL